MKEIIIAIDGFSSCGKSTLAKDLAKQLGFVYIDSGAMYRAVTLYFLQKGINWNDPVQVGKALAGLRIEFSHSPAEGNRTLLNGEDVEEKIRTMSVSAAVSQVAAISAVRRDMVRQQQAMGSRKGIVMDGRDIGTVVFPGAELKLFITAQLEERVRRRYEELKQKGSPAEWGQVRENLLRRDHIDSTRADSPLRQAEDAVVIDNTHITQEEQLRMALEMAREIVG
jgi:CMP/dCMP kinase